MSVTHRNQSRDESKKRRLLSPEKKFQIFLESHTGKTPVGELLRREGIYSTDLARIPQKVREGALERLADRPGARRKVVPWEDYESMKRELEDKERALAEQAVQLAIVRKKRMGVRGSDRGPMVRGATEAGYSTHNRRGERKRHCSHAKLCPALYESAACGALAHETKGP
jgi:transposase-like protein